MAQPAIAGGVPRAPARPLPEADARGGIIIEIIDADGRLAGRDAGWLIDSTRRAVEAMGAQGEVRVRVVGDTEMARAHEKYSGVAGTTDVLTFNMADPAEPGGAGELDIDLLVCLDVADREAAARGHPPARELLLYIIHGVLHCMGHDDHDESAAAAMHAEEDRVLDLIGVGRTFDTPPGDMS